MYRLDLISDLDMIEYILTDINFHYECGLLADGDYSMFWKCVREMKLSTE